MNDINQFRERVRELIEIWKKSIKPHIEEAGEYGETNTRKYLIDPILEALNWVDDGSKKIIDNEFAVKHKTGTGSADYALKVNEVPKILIEAKDVAKVKDLENGYDTIHGIKRTYPRQLSNYCHDLNHQGFDIKFAILTNGKEWILYNMQYADISSEREVVFRLSIEELDKPENLQKLWSLEYIDFCAGYNRLRELIHHLHDYRLGIDKKAVQQLLECKELLSNSILNDYEENKRRVKNQIDSVLEDKEEVNGMPIFQDIPEEERLNFFIKEASSSIINKILFIRILEDKNFLTPKLTKRSIEKWKDFWGYKDYNEIMNLFREACRVSEKTYNGGLFRLNPYDQIDYNPDVIKKIIDILGEINFREIDSDIIGRIYEIYLGQVLKVESEIRGKKRTRYIPDSRERKKLGQYYTPKFIVDFIVKNTLGKLIEGKSSEKISEIRILDPACGSGSFLINTYDTLVDYYENWNNAILKKIVEESKKEGAKLTKYQDSGIVFNYKNLILKENIHGVDINDLSVQICEINLWLRALERDKKLIKLNKNILHGNSLITGVENVTEISFHKEKLEEIKKRTAQIKDYYEKDELTHEEKKRLEALELRLKVLKDKINIELNENLKEYFNGNLNRVHPFNWEVEFPQVMQEKGFDVVIGNPPYIRIQGFSEEDKKYLKDYYISAKRKFDTYILFIERALKLLKEGGYFGFIIPNKFTQTKYGEAIKDYILKNYRILTYIDFGDLKVFEDVTTYPCILIIQKSKAEGLSNYVKVKKLTDNIYIHLQKHHQKNEYEDTILKVFKFNQKDLNSSHWSFLPKNLSKIFEKIKRKGEKTLFDLREHIYEGFISGNNEVYFADNKKIEKYNIEKDILKPVPKGQNVRRYSILWNDEFIIFPHKKIGDSVQPLDLDKYPNAKKFFENNRKKLEKRKYVLKAGKKWFEIWNTRDTDWFNQDKIITPNLASTNNFAFDFKDNKSGKYFYIDHDCYGIILKNKNREDYIYLTGLLNSKVIEFFFKQISPMFSGGYYKYHTQYLDKIPIISSNIPIKNKTIKLVIKTVFLKKQQRLLTEYFNQALSNQSIPDPKSCKFAHYFNHYELYNMRRETANKINEIKAEIFSMNVKEESDQLAIYITYHDEEQERLQKNIKAVKLVIEDEDIRKFLFFSIKGYIGKKKGKGFGKGNLLELIKKIEIPVYVVNAEKNIDKIREIMKEFKRNTKDLWWKDESQKKNFDSLTEMEEEIKKTDEEIDETIYELYGITEEEKKIIEDSLK